MQPRINNPVLTLPGAREALLTIARTTESGDVPRATLELLHLRVGQINGCSVYVDMHSRALRKLGEGDARIFALALAEAATRLSDRADAVPDEVWKEVSRHFSDAALAALVMHDRHGESLEPPQRPHAAANRRFHRAVRLSTRRR
jgi:AhpD family alkylhydroperoxidase